ncbi:Tryptophan--tRNA ligase [Candidatus Anstonella stagnisolia]|nr:Tryptophan--tRNA ligase [Candidatus Anstonella stagnisolia]
MADFNVTPWDVSGAIDYDKLIMQFGTKKISPALKERIQKSAGELHPMLSRDYFFSHRDMDLALDEHEKGKGFFLYTGRGPSGPMHIGHLVPLVFTKWLQDKFKCNLYIQITDDEKFLVKQGMQWEDTQKYSHENILDIIAAGFDPKRTFIFKDSEYIKNVYPLLLKTARKTTMSTAKAVFGFTDSSNIGLTFYPAYQIVPTFFEKKRCLIPSAIDQDPYWRIQRDIAESLGYFKTAAIHSKFLPPLSGTEGKMSSSAADSAIWLSDDAKAVKNKINKYAFSGGKSSMEEHRKLGGNPDIDVPFQWLKIFFEPSDKKLQKLHDDYKSGALLSGEMKAALIEKINTFLAAHKEKREAAKESIRDFMHEGPLAKRMWEQQF